MQRKYALQLLKDIGFTVAKHVAIPMDPGAPLSDSEGDLLADSSKYQRVVEILIYLTISQPDIS